MIQIRLFLFSDNNCMHFARGAARGGSLGLFQEPTMEGGDPRGERDLPGERNLYGG